MCMCVCMVFDLNSDKFQLRILFLVCVSFCEHLCSYVEKNANGQTMANLPSSIIPCHSPLKVHL